jgi:glycosyltransferase involved in cell wall biosynthesis
MALNIDVVVPALNEAQAIGRVLAEIPAWVRRVVVVDNGSSDETAAIAEKAGARVVYENRRGYGYACLAGIAVLERSGAGEQRPDPPQVVVFLDGDYSDYPGEMEQVVAPIRSGLADLVIGSRLAGQMQPGAMLWHARLGNRLLSFLVRRLTGAQVSDIGPFRAIRWECLQALNMEEGRYGWTLEMMLKAARRGYRMLETPVSYRPRLGRSKVSGSVTSSLKAAVVMLWTVARYAAS